MSYTLSTARLMLIHREMHAIKKGEKPKEEAIKVAQSEGGIKEFFRSSATNRAKMDAIAAKFHHSEPDTNFKDAEEFRSRFYIKYKCYFRSEVYNFVKLYVTDCA